MKLNPLFSPATILRWAALMVFCLAGAPLSGVNFPLTWRWSNPTPHGNNIIDMANGAAVTVQVCERGQVYTSTDLLTWVPQDSHTTNALRAVTFFGNRIVITGANGIVLYADSSSDFKLVDLSTTDWLEGVVAAPTLLVTVGDNGAIYTSNDGATWQRHTQSFVNWLRSVAYGNNVFVAVGEGGFIATSSNGSTWQTRTGNTTEDLNKVTFLNDRFWAVGDGGVTLTSSSGSNWQPTNPGATNALFGLAANLTQRLVAGDIELRSRGLIGNWVNELDPGKAAPAPTWTYFNALYDGRGFLLGGRTGMIVEGTNTASGLAWSQHSESIRNWLWDLTRTPDFYVAVGDNATIMTSGDGHTWSIEVPPESAANSVFLGVGGTTNLLLAVGDQGTLIYSPNIFTNITVTNTVGANEVVTDQTVSTYGVYWYAVEPRPTTKDLQGIGALNDVFVVTGDSGLVMTSSNGTNWTTRATPTTAFLSSVASFPDGLVAVGALGTILSSPNGIAWTAQSSGTTNWIYRVRYLNGKLLAVGQSGTILTSDDGMSWIPHNSGTTSWLNDITFLAGSYFIFGNQGTLLTSTDAVTWNRADIITEKSLFGAATFDGQLLTVGVEGIVLRSQAVPAATAGVLSVSPATDFNASGFAGGPFSPSAQLYTLTNSGSSVLSWTASYAAPWLSLSATDGTLEPTASTNITTFLNANANALAAGNYTDTVAFTNTTMATLSATRLVNLTIYLPPKLSVLPSLSPGEFRLQLAGPARRTFYIEATADMAGWLRLITNMTSADGKFEFSDPNTGPLPQRFYRGVATP